MTNHMYKVGPTSLLWDWKIPISSWLCSFHNISHLFVVILVWINLLYNQSKMNMLCYMQYLMLYFTKSLKRTEYTYMKTKHHCNNIQGHINSSLIKVNVYTCLYQEATHRLMDPWHQGVCNSSAWYTQRWEHTRHLQECIPTCRMKDSVHRHTIVVPEDVYPRI